MWILLIVFLLLSARIGWSIWVFLVVAGALLLALAVKLAWIVRYTSRARAAVPPPPPLGASTAGTSSGVSGSSGAASLPPPPPPPPPPPHDLDPNVFFFRRPWLMLQPIKLLLFFVSLVRERGREGSF